MEPEEVLAHRLPGWAQLPNNHNESVTEMGNETIHSQKEMTKNTDNHTGSTLYSETVITSLKNNSKRHQECIVDEDCKSGNYCYFADSEYKCLPCKATEPCTRDGECCEGLCVWGQCAHVTKGEGGTICESQEDCNPGFCCAVHSDLLFPVCTPLPGEGEPCLDPSNKLVDIMNWDVQPAGVLGRCPCSQGLVCQPQSHALVSTCQEPSPDDSKRSDLEVPEVIPPFIGIMPQEGQYYEDGTQLSDGPYASPSEESRSLESRYGDPLLAAAKRVSVDVPEEVLPFVGIMEERDYEDSDVVPTSDSVPTSDGVDAGPLEETYETEPGLVEKSPFDDYK
uniref:Dickkopf N-terminal cysteine-rich domain-containing protein n=1 Tax=Xenopus tropicalis TaxID=8364 RepID=F6QZ43_XENTR